MTTVIKTKTKWIRRTKATVMLGLTKPVKKPVMPDTTKQRQPRLPWGEGLSAVARKRRRIREAALLERLRALDAPGVKDEVDKRRRRRSISPSLPVCLKQDDSGDEVLAAELGLQHALDPLQEGRQKENIPEAYADTPHWPLYCSPSLAPRPLSTIVIEDRLVPSDRDYFRTYFAELARRKKTVRPIL